jgi:hypothetical protein
MAIDLGTDMWCRFGVVSTRVERGKDRVINRICRRITTPRGRLHFHPDYGIDMTTFIGAEHSPERTRRIESELRAEIEAEATVDASSVRVDTVETVVNHVTSLDFQIRANTTQGPVDFVATVNAVTLDLLGVREVSS